jgi:hypothetical protein
LTQSFPCFGDAAGASLVWYCQDIFKWKQETQEAQVDLVMLSADLCFAPSISL